MWVDFDKISINSRVWVFQSDSILKTEDQDIIDEHIKLFIEKWSSHGAQMYASHTIIYNCFVVIAADEEKQCASGCSIDSFTSLFKSLGEHLNLSFFDRFAIAHKSGGEFFVSALEDFKTLIKEGVVTENTIVFNNLVATKEEFINSWELPIKKSWQKRYL